MLLKQSQVLTHLASLDEEEAARAESAGLRWQVSPFASLTHFSYAYKVVVFYTTRLLYFIRQPLLPRFLSTAALNQYLSVSQACALLSLGSCCAHALMLCLCCAHLLLRLLLRQHAKLLEH